jgi:hypothetical protein
MKLRSFTLMSVALLAFASTARANCPTNQFFTPATSFLTGNAPFNVAIADVNGDGNRDLIVTVNGLSKIGVLLGIGNGSFDDVVTYPVNPGTGNLIVVDLDRDGVLDVATNSSGTDVISVLEGNGDGTFQPQVDYPAGDAPYGVASADFNGDGIPDLAASAFLNGAVSVMLGLPEGGYAAPAYYVAGEAPYALATADFNHDGKPDLVASNQNSSNLTVFLGNGDGTFATGAFYPVGLYPYSIAIADFDEDGISDLAVANGGNGTLSVLRGNGSGGAGDGTFAPATSISLGGQPRSVAAGDLDRDGITDLVTADYSGVVGVLLGQGSGGVGNGTFASPFYFSAGPGPTCVAIGDFNADTLADLAVANYTSNRVSVLLHGCGSPPPPPPSPSPTLTAVRDVPNDQGGRVFVTWLRSGLDGGPYPEVTGYRVWRRIAPATAMAAAIEVAGSPAARIVTTRVDPGPFGPTVTYWEALITLPAEHLDGYGYTAPTTQDSMASGNPYTAFFVTALTSNPNVFYQSSVDSGYSVDNIPPAQPSGLYAAAHPEGFAVHWFSNHETDLDVYRVYRGSTPGFIAGRRSSR